MWKEDLAHEERTREPALFHDALQRPAPDFRVIRDNHHSSAVGCLLAHYDVAPGLPRLNESVLLQNIANLAADRMRSLGMRRLERSDFHASIQPAFNLLVVRVFEKDLHRFLDHSLGLF